MLFSSSQDCTVRQWDIKDNHNCVRIFKMQDPCNFTCVHKEHNLLFTASWDKIVRAIDLKTAEIDRSFVASTQAIKCMLQWDKWLFVSGMDPTIRAYDLTTGNVKVFEGHKSWVLQMQQYIRYKDDGETIKFQWLFSSSDDGSIRIWDIATQNCLQELTGHKNGVTGMAFANNQMFTSSFDHYVIAWDLAEIEERIFECQRMMAEDLRSKKFEAFEAYMESKGKRKKPKGKKAKKGKK